MNRLLFKFIVLSHCFLFSPMAIAQANCEETLDGTQHQYFQRIKGLFEGIRRVQQRAGPACKMVELSSGKPIDDMISHYESLVTDLATLIDATCGMAGGGSSGYAGARTYFNTRRLIPYLPNALKFMEDRKGKVSWSEWVNRFDGDSKLALMAVIGSTGWIRTVLPEEDKEKLNEIYEEASRCREDKQMAGAFVDPYSACGMPQNIWGLDLSRSRRGSFGRAYKTISGMNLAMALFEKGYSEDDIVMAIGRATAVYETVDLLYDHLGFETPSYLNFQYDHPRRQYQQLYLELLQKIRLQMQATPNLKRELLGSLAGVSSLFRVIPGTNNLLDLNDDFNLTLALLTLHTDDRARFDRLFAKHLYGKPPFLRELFDAGTRDINTTVEGASFVTRALKNTQPRDGKKWSGALSKIQRLNWVCQKATRTYDAAKSMVKDNAVTNLKGNIETWLRNTHRSSR